MSVRQPIQNMAVAERIVFQIDFAHHTHDRHIVVILGYISEICHRMIQNAEQLRGPVLLNRKSRMAKIGGMQTLGASFLFLARHRRIVQFSQTVTVHQHQQGFAQHFAPRQVEAWLFVTHIRSESHRHHRHLLETRRHHCVLNQGDVVGGAALTASLRNRHRDIVQVVFSALQGRDDAACHYRGRIAHLIVGIAQALFR